MNKKQDAMKKKPFGDMREWETALLTLPEESFFSLVRSVFGSIKTPFSKQRLVDDLKAFLSNEENRKTLEAYIDEKDALLIASVAVLENPTEQELTDFIGGELTGNVHAFLINMEERLIVYRFKKGRIAYIALNPLLEGVLDKFARNTRRLFPSVSHVGSVNSVSSVRRTEGPDAYFPAIDDRFIAASFSFALEKEGGSRNGGGLRKNGFGASKMDFPQAARYCTGALRVLELLHADGAKMEEKLEVNARSVARFGKLSPRERLEYYVTGVYLYQHKTGSLHQRFNEFNAFHQGQIKTIAAFVHQFLDFFAIRATDDARRYPRIALQRIAILLQRRGLGADQDRSVSLPNLADLLSCLETLGILIPDESSLWRINPAVFDDTPRSESQTVLNMDTEFSCILYPGIDFSDAFDLAFFSEVREMGAVVRFELTRESVVRGFDHGISADAMIRLLNRLSGGRVSQNLRYYLKDWEDRRRFVSLHHGLVLCLDEERRYLAEIEPFSRFVAQALAPGVYLLYNIERSEAVRALRHMGVDIVAQTTPSASGDVAGGGASSAFGAFASDDYEIRFPALASSDLSHVALGEPDAQEEALPLKPERAARYLEHFRRVLDNSSVPKSKQEELKVHIENRLILNEEQLSEDCVSYKKMEAHLLDQTGKASIIRDAITTKSTLDVRWITMDANGGKNGRDGGHERDAPRYAERHAVGVPKKLEKSEGKLMLFLETQEGETSIPLRKILCIRKIKKSIFE
ncbi:MAG: helicase-associated domain-containing protein [Treponema sp.]|nr:helicase-associated domain-containing protein [Treponema sp.]